MADRKTLGQFLERAISDDASPSPELRTLLLDLAGACKTIARRLAEAPLRTGGAQGTAAVDSHGMKRFSASAKGDVLSIGDSRRFWIARLRSRACAEQQPKACHLYRGRLQAVLLPLDRPSNAEVNAPGATIFSVLRTEAPGHSFVDNGVQRPGRALVCSGYAIHGPSLVLVLAIGQSVQAFALDRQKDEFVLTNPDIRIPAATDRIAIDASRARFWTPPIRRYVDECLAGETGPRGKDFRMHWLGSMAAEAHRILTCGGVFVCPGRGRMVGQPPQPWLLQEANPISFVIERAGGRSSTGTARILDIGSGVPPSRPALIFGSSEEVERLETYHGGNEAASYDAPLFGQRGLFRSSV